MMMPAEQTHQEETAVHLPPWVRLHTDLRQRHIEQWVLGYAAQPEELAILSNGRAARACVTAGILVLDEGREIGELTVRETAHVVSLAGDAIEAALAHDDETLPDWVRVIDDPRQKHVEAWLQRYAPDEAQPVIARNGEAARAAVAAGFVAVEAGRDIGELTVSQTLALVEQVSELLTRALDIDPN